MKLRLEARVSSNSPDAVGRFLVGKFGATSVTRDGNDWFVRAAVDSASARDAKRLIASTWAPVKAGISSAVVQKSVIPNCFQVYCCRRV